MNIVLLGPPGAGKGTQAQYLKDHYGMMHISTGDLLRKEIAAGTELGLKTKSIIDSGNFMPDEIIIDLIQQQITKPEAAAGVIFDGFPRTINQAIALDEMLGKLNQSVTRVIEIQVNDQELIKRITGRFACQECGAGYNDFSKMPVEQDTCDVCGGHTFNRRADDTVETVTTRLKKYHDETMSIIPYYLGKGILTPIDGMADMKKVTLEIDHALGHA